MNSLKVVLDRSDVGIAIVHMAKEIYKLRAAPLAIVAVLKGGAYVAYEVLKLLDTLHNMTIGNGDLPRYHYHPDIVIGHIGLKSYGEEMKSSGEVKLLNPLDLSRECLRGRNVIIVDDCIETGITIKEAKKIISGYDSLGIYTAVLVDKVTLRIRHSGMVPDIVGWSYLDEGFLVGCGMGDGEKYRGLPEVYEVTE